MIEHQTRIVTWMGEAKPYHAQCECGWQAPYPVVRETTAIRHAQRHEKAEADKRALVEALTDIAGSWMIRKDSPEAAEIASEALKAVEGR